jgi:hypothetical protein
VGKGVLKLMVTLSLLLGTDSPRGIDSATDLIPPRNPFLLYENVQAIHLERERSTCTTEDESLFMHIKCRFYGH